MRTTPSGILAPAGTMFFVALLASVAPPARAADSSPALTPEQKEHFLVTAHVMKEHGVKKGITGTVRVTMSDGAITHDASVQRIDESKQVFEAADGSREYNFKDSYKFNVAGWRLARLLGIGDMVPPSVQRSYEGKTAAYTWWIEDVQMDEATRVEKKINTPDTDSWNHEMYVVRVFDQLIYNMDRNLTNLLIDNQWHIWMIDHTRSFRLQHALRNDKNLVQCDRDLLAKLKTLDEPALEKELRLFVSKDEIKAVLARRDLIVKFFEAKGESALYNRPPRT
jgi:hypothetical protein